MTLLSPNSFSCVPTLLLSDDYYPSDIAWLELKNPKV